MWKDATTNLVNVGVVLQEVLAVLSHQASVIR
jgi:hypothetical protein